MPNVYKSLIILGWLSAALFLLNTAALAQSKDGLFSDLSDFGDLLLPPGTQFTLGAGARLGPDYFGSDEYEVRPDLAFFFRFGRKLTLTNDGTSLDILGLKDFSFGPVVRITGGRDEDENDALTGLGNIGASLDFGVFAKVNVADHFTARLRFFHAAAFNDNGGVIDLRLRRLLYQSDNLSVALGLRASWATEQRIEQFFGIDAEQAERSGLPEFSPGASFQDVRLALGASWSLSKQWSLNGFVRYARLLDDIVDSPIVTPLGSPNQFTIGSFLAYRFEVE